MHLSEFVGFVEKVLPSDTAMSGDRIGIHVLSERQSASAILFCMEVNEAVMNEAIASGCDCIMSFHPLIYKALQQVGTDERVDRCVRLAIKHDIAIVVVHTTLDAHPQGTNWVLAKRLGLDVINPLVADTNRPDFGMGLVCTSNGLRYLQLIDKVKEVCGNAPRYSAVDDFELERIAIVAGSGFSFFGDALRTKVDVFITADVKYHDFHAASGKMALIDPGHYEMEQFVADSMIEILNQAFAHVPDRPRFQATTVNTNPVRTAR